MKYALQIYGVFRTFEKCLPDILKYINFDIYDYDVFVLSQRADGYSIENEQRIRELLKGRIIKWKYIEDYDQSYHITENAFCQEYESCLREAISQIQPRFSANSFVTRLWYRRFLNNEMRKKYEKTHQIHYDWVIRTRFDVGYSHETTDSILSILEKPPQPQTIYFMPDLFTCGPADAIDYESNLINEWPYIYHQYKKNGGFPKEYLSMKPDDFSKFISAWLFMSEVNLTAYLAASPYQPIGLPHILHITRSNFSGSVNKKKSKEEQTSPIVIPHEFDWKFYLDKYEDLRQAGLKTPESAWDHYTKYGKNEGRMINEFDWKFYLDKYEDLRQAGLKTPESAWDHYIKYGKNEGRLSRSS